MHDAMMRTPGSLNSLSVSGTGPGFLWDDWWFREHVEVIPVVVCSLSGLWSLESSLERTLEVTLEKTLG